MERIAQDIGKEKRRREITLPEHYGYVHLAPEPLSILLHSVLPPVTLMDYLTKWLQVGIGQHQTLGKLERGKKRGQEAAPFISQSGGVAKGWPHLSTKDLGTSLGVLSTQPLYLQVPGNTPPQIFMPEAGNPIGLHYIFVVFLHTTYTVCENISAVIHFQIVLISMGHLFPGSSAICSFIPVITTDRKGRSFEPHIIDEEAGVDRGDMTCPRRPS